LITNQPSLPIQIRAFPRGDWLIKWLGDVGLHLSGRSFSQMSYTIELKGVGDNGLGRRTIYLPIGMLAMTPIGSHWRDGIRIEPSPYADPVATFNVVSYRSFLKPAGASFSDPPNTGFILPFDIYGGHSEHTKSCLLACTVGDNRLVLIPALEPIRFYFGSSGTLLRHIFTYNFSLESVCDAASLSQDEFLRAHIDLKQDIPGSSAGDIARLAFSEIALNAARSIWSSLHIGREQSGKPYPRAILPFKGSSGLQVRGFGFETSEGGYRFVVHQILSCTHRFPFGSLTYTTRWTSPRNASNRIQLPGPANGVEHSATHLPLPTEISVVEDEPRKAESLIAVPYAGQEIARPKFTHLAQKYVVRVEGSSSAPYFGNPGGDDSNSVGTQTPYGVGAGVASGEAISADFYEQPASTLVPATLPLPNPGPVWKELRRFGVLMVSAKKLKLSVIALDPLQEYPHFSVFTPYIDMLCPLSGH
jgi:hypothetical protein